MRLRKQEPFFNQLFLQALGIAVMIHLVGFCSIQIKSFKIINSEPERPPVIVNASIDRQENSTQVYLDSEVIRRRYPLEPKGSTPELPKMLTRQAALKSATTIEKNFLVPTPFSKIEEQYVLPVSFSLTQKVLSPIDIHISGPLANQTLIHNGTQNLKTEKIQDQLKEQRMAKFAVQTEEKTGQIFWYELIQSTENADLDRLAEQIIEKMRFQQKVGHFIATGAIEIRFNP